MKTMIRTILLALACAIVACSKPSAAPGGHLFAAAAPATTPASWSVPAWWIDPADVTGCASDSNNGQNATCGAAGVGPLLDLATIVSRWGTNNPVLTSGVTITLLSDAPSSDPWTVIPTHAGGGLRLQGVPSVVTTVTLGTYTPANYAAGTKPTITASGQSGAYWAPYVNAIVHDVTANATFVLDEDKGSATGGISTPFTLPIAAFPFPPQATLTSGDTLQVLRMPTLYASSFTGTNLTSSVSPILGLQVADLTLHGAQLFLTLSPGTFFLEDVFAAPYVGPSTSELLTTLTSCSFGSALAEGGSLIYYGGAMAGVASVFGEGVQLDGDVHVNVRNHWATGGVKLREVYFGQINDDDVYGVSLYEVLNSNGGGAARVWGPGGFNVISGNRLLFDHGITATASLLLTGALEIDGSTTAFPWLPGSNAYGPAVTITPAALDANKGLSNPASGSAIFVRP